MDDACLKLTVYCGEEDRNEHGRVGDSLLELFERRQVEVSMLTAGAEGFGRSRQVHTDLFVDSAYDLPLVLIAVDRRAAIQRLLPEVRDLVTSGIVTLTDGRLLPKDVRRAAAGPGPGHSAVRLTVFLARDDDIDGVPAYRVVVDRLRANRVGGATVILGGDGTFRGRRERAGLFQKRPGSPLMIVSVGQTEEIENALPMLADILPDPLMLLEPVRVCKRDGALLREPGTVDRNDHGEFEVFQQLVVFSGLHGLYRRHPLHLELVSALLRGSASGVTVLHGIWGYAHDELPHGERAWSLQRRIPTVTVVIENSSRLAQTFAVMDSLTESAGLVTCEVVRGYYATASASRAREPLLRRLHLRSHS